MKEAVQHLLGKSMVVGALIAFLAACAPQKTPVATECVANADQKALFKGHWSTHPIPLAVVANDFSVSELTALEEAISTWNSFFKESKGFELYLSGSTPLSTVSGGTSRVTSASACAQTIIGASGFKGKLMIYKTRSGWSFGSQVMALTSLCPVTTANSTYRMFTSAVMEINFQNYFNAGQPIPDLQSIVTHELGHMLGLDHSCTGNGCAEAPDDYVSAMMYPSLGFDGVNGRVRRDLNKNDQQRANCLY